MSKDEISQFIDEQFEKLPDFDQFMKGVFFDYFHNILKPRLIDGKMTQTELESVVKEFLKSH